MTNIKAGDMVRLSERIIRYWLGSEHAIDREAAILQNSFIRGGIAIVTKITREEGHPEGVEADNIAHILRPDGERDEWSTSELEKI